MGPCYDEDQSGAKRFRFERVLFEGLIFFFFS
jgi:hypothetical protein